MSLLFGIFYRDGKPVSEELCVMYKGLKHCPHEKYNVLVKGNCGFGHMLTYNTPEAVNECMPRWIEEQKLLFVAEGRIDNRDELFQLLTIPANQQATIPDGELILVAYQKWGEECVDKLMGKWSLAAFRSDTQKLFIARDKWDYTALDYYIDNDVIVFASSTKGILSLPFINPEIDEFLFARLFAVWPGDFDKTYYKGIKRLLPSYKMNITCGQAQINRYWNYTDIPIIKGLKLDDYCENLFDNFEKAVKCRLRSYKPIAATLSGGMDSSSVCVLAAKHLANEGKQLRTYSHIPRFAPSAALSENIFGNEKPFIDAIVEMYKNIDPVFFKSEHISPLEGIKKSIQLHNGPVHAMGNAYWLVELYNKIASENNGTLLLGEMGNATTSWKGLEEYLSFEELTKRYGIKKAVKIKIINPLLYGKNSVAKLYNQLAFGSEPWRKQAYSTEDFEQSLDFATKIKASDFDPTYKTYLRDEKAQRMQIFNLSVIRLPMSAYAQDESGFEFRDPTGDVRVIESALSIPNEMFFGKMNKWILRTMMKGKLPDKVRLNTKTGRQSSDLAARICAYPEEMNYTFNEMENSKFSEIADMERIKLEWEKMQAHSDTYPRLSSGSILRIVGAYEFWKNCNAN